MFICAKAGVGDHVGLDSAIGFWAGAAAGTTFHGLVTGGITL